MLKLLLYTYFFVCWSLSRIYVNCGIQIHSRLTSQCDRPNHIMLFARTLFSLVIFGILSIIVTLKNSYINTEVKNILFITISARLPRVRAKTPLGRSRDNINRCDIIGLLVRHWCHLVAVQVSLQSAISQSSYLKTACCVYYLIQYICEKKNESGHFFISILNNFKVII